MEYYNYSDVNNFVYDKELQKLLCVDLDYNVLLAYLIREDFLKIDETVRIPFFAETRDYVGAREKDNSASIWIVKPVKGDEIIGTEMATICFFLDLYTHSISAPIVITRINDIPYKATKLINSAEQLSGANYMEDKQLKEQLLLDLINRWIYFDEDRNPNNYMIKYNSRNDQIIIAIDFLNVDLITSDVKIEGSGDSFGWERKEKTRYLTPLKCENWLDYDMDFFNIRFNYFNKLTGPFLENTCYEIIRWNTDKTALSKLIAGNLINRVKYVYSYFKSHISEKAVKGEKNKYKEMGETFGRYYGDDQ